MVLRATNTLANEDVGYIDGIIRDFNNKLAEFDRLRRWFIAEKDVAKTDARLNQEYDALMKRADLLQGTIQKAKDAINQLNNMVENMTPDWLRDWLNNTNGDSLGLVPLLVAGAITGALAWLGTWITDAYIVGKKIEAQKIAIAAGADPTKATEAVFGAPEETMFGFGAIGTLGLLLLAGGAVFLFQKYYA
jgi:hypothetical protein